jgi:hypothetical protein
MNFYSVFQLHLWDDKQAAVTQSFYLRSALISDFMRSGKVVSYPCFATMYWSHCQGSTSPCSSWTAWPLNMWPISCPKCWQENVILHCVKSQNSADLIYTAVEAWNYESFYVCDGTHWCYEQQSKFVSKCWSAKQSAVFLLIVRYKKILEGTGRQRLTQELASNNSSDILWNSVERTVTLRELQIF